MYFTRVPKIELMKLSRLKNKFVFFLSSGITKYSHVCSFWFVQLIFRIFRFFAKTRVNPVLTETSNLSVDQFHSQLVLGSLKHLCLDNFRWKWKAWPWFNLKYHLDISGKMWTELVVLHGKRSDKRCLYWNREGLREVSPQLRDRHSDQVFYCFISHLVGSVVAGGAIIFQLQSSKHYALVASAEFSLN